MAGDWIKLESVTPDKPEVIGIAARLGIDQDAATGKLIRLWIWADQQTYDGNAVCNASVTLAALPKSFIDRIACVTGFADAMESVGWLHAVDGGFTFPNFTRHNGQTAKQRAVTSKRVKKHRTECNAECNGASVTSSVTKPLPEGEGEGDISDIETRRDETALFENFDWSVVRSEAARFRGLGMGEKPQDRSLVLKTCALALSGRIPQDWLEQCIEALKLKTRKKPAAYFTACMTNKAKEAGKNFRQLLATVVIPKET